MATEVHRTLRLSSPHLHGVDVRALQGRLNHELNHRRFPWRTVTVDGEYGPQSRNAAHMVGWLIGLSHRRLKAIHAGRITQPVQHLLRNPEDRLPADRLRDSARRTAARKLRQAHNSGPQAAVGYIEEMARKDVHEVGSTNTGPMVDKWEAFFGIHGEPWCGCLAGYAAKVAGGSKATTWFPYGPSIMADARAGRNGVFEVGFDNIQPGDVLVLWNGEHIVTAAASPNGDQIRTGEGNTSPNPVGDQTNGGSVEMKVRSRSDVSCAARPY
jgi:hypothetical protein